MTATFSHLNDMKFAIDHRTVRVMTVGLGYVGLPLALTIHESGFNVVGFDINCDRAERISRGEPVISYMPENRISDAVATGRFDATSDASQLEAADIILICVPTPLKDDRTPDLRHVISASEEVARRLRPGQMIVLESTVWPGATQNVVRPILERGGLRAGVDFFLGFSPEREDPGNNTHTTQSIPKVVGADDPHSLQLLQQFYDLIVSKTVPVSSTATAEAVKLLENSFRNVNIALVNEAKQAFDAMGVDIWEVVDAAATKPFGFMPFYPGPGIGGDCIPVSPAYLSWRAKDVGSSTPLVDLARTANEQIPANIALQIVKTLAHRGVAIENARILIVGIAYKKDVEDTRESPALALLIKLEALGAKVNYHDPYFPVMPTTRDHPQLAGYRSSAINHQTLDEMDAVVIATDHTNVDYAAIAASGVLTFDTRNVFARRGISFSPENLIKL